MRVNLTPGQQRFLIASASKGKTLKDFSLDRGIPYSTFKKYYQEAVLLPDELFNRLIEISSLRKGDFNFTYLDENWGRSLGGKAGMAVLRDRYKDKIKGWRVLGGRNSRKKKLK